MKKVKEQAKSVSERGEEVADIGARHMFDRLMEVRKLVGKRPYRALPVSEKELTNRWLEIRENSDAVYNVLGENMRLSKDGRVLIRRDLIDRVKKIETDLKNVSWS